MEEKKADETCGKGSCGMRCGCCTCKAIKGIVLLLIGGAIGFGLAHCRSLRMCPMSTTTTVKSESVQLPNEMVTPQKSK